MNASVYHLPHQCEFLSDEWLDAMRRFLGRNTAQHVRARGQRFVVSAMFTQVPPHLQFDRNLAYLRLCCDGEHLSVDRTHAPEAALCIEGDYQAALTALQFVGLLVPGAAAAMLREVATMYGADALRVRGRIEDADAQQLLLSLHDHMGRRTVENPDLAHRAERQGLTGKIRELEEEGYTVIERAISSEFADQTRDAVLRALLPHQSFSMNWMLYHGREFEQLIQNPMLMTLIDASLGRGAVIASFSSIRKGPGPGVIPLHTDYSHVPEPYPEFALTGVGVWAFEDWTVDSGPTWIVPGSHRMRRPPRRGENHPPGVAIEMPKGSVVYFTHGVWHWQGDRTQAGDRVTLHAHFNRGILRSLEPKKTDVQLLHRNAPRLGEMLGEDDWFDKMSAEGRDHVRMTHMAKLLAFNDEQKRSLLAGAN